MVTHFITVSGRVQGVGFRAYVLSTAKVYGLQGEVWNSRDGSVQLYAQNEDARLLLQLEEELKRGPGRVDAVVSQEMPQASFGDFTIGPTR